MFLTRSRFEGYLQCAIEDRSHCPVLTSDASNVSGCLRRKDYVGNLEQSEL